MTDVSATTKAILMLAAPLLAGGRTEKDLLLKPAEYRRLAQTLQRLACRPGDLLGPEAAALLHKLEGDFDRARLERLLGRGLQLGMALEHWQRRSIQVISRADALYPRRLKQALGHESPVLLYFCGNAELLHGGGLAVVGSRQVDEDLLAYTRNVGALAANAECAIVSGGAKGVDQASMQGAAAAGGRVVGVLGNNLERAVMQRDNRNALMRQALLLCSPFDPAAGFQAWQAMNRNKLIYALSDAALVVQSAVNKGGTWGGAKEQLQKFHCVPVYTRTEGPPSSGLEALRRLGAFPWPEPKDVDAFRAVMDAVAQPDKPRAATTEMAGPDVGAAQGQEGPSAADRDEDAWAAELWDKVEELVLRLLQHESLSAAQIAQKLRVGPGQARSWMEQMVAAGQVAKLANPVRYQLGSAEPAPAAEDPSRLDRERGEAERSLEAVGGGPAREGQDPESRAVPGDDQSAWATELQELAAEALLAVLACGPLSAPAVSAHVEVNLAQTQLWLEQLTAVGKLVKTTKPVRYQVAPSSSGQPDVATPEAETAARPDTAMGTNELKSKVEDLLMRLLAHDAWSARSVAQTLQVNPGQARAWLEPLVQAGKLAKTSRPVRYQRIVSERQTSLL